MEEVTISILVCLQHLAENVLLDGSVVSLVPAELDVFMESRRLDKIRIKQLQVTIMLTKNKNKSLYYSVN
jgi:hypothetical protein